MQSFSNDPSTWLGAGRLAVCTLLALTLLACDTSPIQGRYYQGLHWLEFRNGVVTHGELGDYIQYRVEGAKVVLFDSTGKIEGDIVSPTTLRFGKGTGAMAEAFVGVWVSRANSGKDVLKDAGAREAAVPLIGEWRVPGETHIFEFRKDGTYAWGPRLSGSYQMLQGQRVRMTIFQDGQRLGDWIDHDFVIEGGTLKLTMPDGAVTTYERVK